MDAHSATPINLSDCPNNACQGPGGSVTLSVYTTHTDQDPQWQWFDERLASQPIAQPLPDRRCGTQLDHRDIKSPYPVTAKEFSRRMSVDPIAAQPSRSEMNVRASKSSKCPSASSLASDLMYAPMVGIPMARSTTIVGPERPIDGRPNGAHFRFHHHPRGTYC